MASGIDEVIGTCTDLALDATYNFFDTTTCLESISFENADINEIYFQILGSDCGAVMIVGQTVIDMLEAEITTMISISDNSAPATRATVLKTSGCTWTVADGDTILTYKQEEVKEEHEWTLSGSIINASLQNYETSRMFSKQGVKVALFAVSDTRVYCGGSPEDEVSPLYRPIRGRLRILPEISAGEKNKLNFTFVSNHYWSPKAIVHPLTDSNCI